MNLTIQKELDEIQEKCKKVTKNLIVFYRDHILTCELRETILNEKISECLQNDGTIAELLAKIWELECQIRKERNRLHHSQFFCFII